MLWYFNYISKGSTNKVVLGKCYKELNGKICILWDRDIFFAKLKVLNPDMYEKLAHLSDKELFSVLTTHPHPDIGSIVLNDKKLISGNDGIQYLSDKIYVNDKGVIFDSLEPTGELITGKFSSLFEFNSTIEAMQHSFVEHAIINIDKIQLVSDLSGTISPS